MKHYKISCLKQDNAIITKQLQSGIGLKKSHKITTDLKYFFRNLSGIIVFLFLTVNLNAFITVDKIDGRWYFLDENGDPFISKGVNKVNVRGGTDRITGRDIYNETIKEKYSDYYEWAESTGLLLEDMNFNTLGAWSDHRYFDDIYFIATIYPGKNNWNTGEIDDYFSEEFYQHTVDTVEKYIVNSGFIENKKLIGYCIGNELRWGIDWRGTKSIVFEYLNLPNDRFGKKAVIAFLQKYYNGDIKTFNRQWFVSFKEWEEALHFTNFKFNTSKGKNAESALLFYIADKYYDVTTSIIREADPNHLILGSRFIGAATPREVVKAASFHCDVISVNYYQLILDLDRTLPYLLNYTKTNNYLKEFHSIGKKPILITEFGFRGKTKDAPSRKPFIFPTYYTEKARSRAFYKEIESFMETDYIIGYHIFKWMDQPKNGRNNTDKEDNNCGIVNSYDEPYPILKNTLRKANKIR